MALVQRASYELIHQSSRSAARVGVIHTPHGDIPTPGFVPVATNGFLKFVSHSQSSKVGTRLTFANTYHLLIHPGPDVVESAGGIHKFVDNPNPMITDSGGFQIFSLANTKAQDELKGKNVKQTESTVLRIKEEGVHFRSYRDGRVIHLTPEKSVQAQKQIGADIIIPLDILLPENVPQEKLISSLEQTHRWEKRSLDEHLNDRRNQAMYAVLHGGTNLELREASLRHLSSLEFDGFAIGGSLGRNKQDMHRVLSHLSSLNMMNPALPRHLLGIADPESIEDCVQYGIDTFDSCYPTRVARHGLIMAENAPIHIRRTVFKNLHEPVTSDTSSPLHPYTFASLHHMYKQKEPLAAMLISYHNVFYMNKLTQLLRDRIMRNEI